MRRATHCNEPDFETACEWWTDTPNIWTPIGWQDHIFRFNVFWNGMILADPALNRRSEQWKNQGVQVSMAPGGSWRSPLRADDGLVRQGWTRSLAPVLWSEWPLSGILFRSEMFAHVLGGQATRKGDEPLFAWIRLSLADLIPALTQDQTATFSVLINGTHISRGLGIRDNVRFDHAQALYPRPLSADSAAYDKRKGLRILEPDGRIRLAVAPGQACRAMFAAPCRGGAHAEIKIELRARAANSVDLLLPMLPTTSDVFERELKLGYDAALRQAERYWTPKPRSSACFRVPEQPINNAIRHGVRLGRLLTERNPATGKVCLLSGSWCYADLWSTPGAMELAMMMDILGCHEFAGRYLEILKEEQGTVVPPGDAYLLHPGFLSTPAAYKSVDWLSDNGAILYALSMHGLLSGDAAYIRRVTDVIVKSCDWIKTHRAIKGHGGYEGILPAARATDARPKIQAVWSDGWNYKGLCAAVRLLKQSHHPRATEFECEARDYKGAFRKAFRDKCRKMRTWKDARGRMRMLVPAALSGESATDPRGAFYLDTGPLFLVFAGLVEADDPRMRDARLWFREGPPWKFYRRDSCYEQPPVLDHEMSSAEPCYSWNIFHSWRMGDRQKFLEGMYSLYAGALSRQTWVSCEFRGGMTGNVFSAPLAIYLARLAVIDDEFEDGALHLLRLLPRAWLKPGAECRFERVPTVYGPVCLTLKRSRDGATLDIRFAPAFRKSFAAPRVVLHRPSVEGLKTVRINGATANGACSKVGGDEPGKERPRPRLVPGKVANGTRPIRR